MAKTHKAPFAQTPRRWSAVVTQALTDIDDSPGSEKALLGQAHTSDGSILTRLSAIPRATTGSAVVLYLFSTLDDTVFRLLRAKAAAADTVSTTDAPNEIDFGYSEDTPLRLQAGEKLHVGASVALSAGWVFSADVMDYA
jgi:hypothetical protein